MVALRTYLPPMSITAIRLWTTCGFLIIGLARPSVVLADDRLTVVELFTSQGCSSCPTADALLGELAEQPHILALSEHVDYWDYLGWKDPFASPAHTQRQRNYALALSVRYVYTPQMIVQGTTQVAGNDKAAVMRAIAMAPPAVVPITLDWQAPDRLSIALTGSVKATPATLWLATFDKTQLTPIGTGENEGKKLHNYNVVRSLRPIGKWAGEPVALIATVAAQHWDEGTCAAILQADDAGAILGAARCGH